MTQDKKENLTSYVSKDEKKEIRLAMAYADFDSMSDFVKEAALEKARKILEEQQTKNSVS